MMPSTTVTSVAQSEQATPVPCTTRLGHVHLKVRNLARSVAFYTRLLGLQVTETVGDRYAFLSGSSLHHELALQSVGKNASTPPVSGIGLYHVAFEAPDKRAFAQLFMALRQTGITAQAVDHGISWAVYFEDPDSNGVEVYVDTRRDPNGAMLWQGVSRALHDEEIITNR